MPARPAARALALWIAALGTVAAVGIVARGGQEADQQVRVAGPAVTAAPATTAAPTTSEAPPTTTAPTTTVAPPPPAPPTTTPPAPAPTTPTAPPTTTAPAPAVVAPASVVNDPAPAATPDYAMSVVRQVIPAAWLAAVPVRVEVIGGKTSWSSWGGLIEIGDWHLTSSVARARFVLAHEWGHQVAWHYGTDVFNGAPPAGFPYSGAHVEEAWADCVAQALTGTSYPSHGLGGCPGDALSFTSAFFAKAPGPRLR